MPDILLVIGDPLMSGAQLAEHARILLGTRFEVRVLDWELPLEGIIAANLAIEKGGADAVPATVATDPETNERVVAVLTQFFPLSRATLAQWPRLRAVATLRAGTENVDVDELRRRHIPFTANAGRNANAVAELGVALILGVLRNVGENHHAVRAGGWRPARPVLGHRELSGRTVGIVGFGAVGRLVARRLSGFDVNIAYYDPYAESGDNSVMGLSLDALLKQSDVITLHARALPDNRAMIGVRELDLMRPGAVLVNTARAELVDEGALIECLADGRLSAAALDVFSVEPLPADHPLRTMPNVMLSPHLAGSTVEARSRAPRLIAEKLSALLGD
ncbi:NAD(P)-dependent oxidoreductase [Glaciibacter superstes]|uniref:NAD(P)-dependent oxidoreductase n=1 Tax=Glaciibacter superstes TaxID=501023 RepID=UPI0003B4C71B|nr:NAD(P)-dependent oxidoreductase [Glaciibacter superstes]